MVEIVYYLLFLLCVSGGAEKRRMRGVSEVKKELGLIVALVIFEMLFCGLIIKKVSCELLFICVLLITSGALSWGVWSRRGSYMTCSFDIPCYCCCELLKID